MSLPTYKRVLIELVTTEDCTTRQGYIKAIQDLQNPISSDTQLVMGTVIDQSDRLEALATSGVKVVTIDERRGPGSFGFGGNPSARLQRTCVVIGMDDPEGDAETGAPGYDPQFDGGYDRSVVPYPSATRTGTESIRASPSPVAATCRRPRSVTSTHERLATPERGQPSMILTYKVIFGVPFRFDLEAQWGARVELEAIAFMNAAPIDWRLGNDPIRSGLHAGHPSMRGFHDLQRAGISGGTRGIPATSLELETRGIGDATVMVWLRPGTYPENGHCGA